jgi:NAD(P)-dependent dehydrogenase (short-subunit alcohol dehydrogenase family)
MVMDSFTGKLAVVTGGGSGTGRELSRQLAARACSVAACDLNPDSMAETVALARAEAAPDVLAAVDRQRRRSAGQHQQRETDSGRAGAAGAPGVRRCAPQFRLASTPTCADALYARRLCE